VGSDDACSAICGGGGTRGRWRRRWQAGGGEPENRSGDELEKKRRGFRAGTFMGLSWAITCWASSDWLDQLTNQSLGPAFLGPHR
jgi:hypothetical protein